MPTEKRPLISRKDLFWILYLWPGCWLAKMLPASLMHGSCRVLTAFLLRLGKPLRKRFSEEISFYPVLLEKTGNPDRLIQSHLSNAILRATNDLLLLRYPVESVVKNFDIKGRGFLEDALGLKHGVIMASGHFFANRLAKKIMKTQGWQVMSVRNADYQDPNMGRLGERHLQKRYFRLLHRIIEDEVDIHDEECVLKILERLRRGGIVNVHFDVPFSQATCDLAILGVVRPFPLGFLEVAQAAGSPIVPMLCLGNHRSLFIEFLPALFPTSHDKKSLMETLVKILESQILKHPEQWEHTMRL
jgi:lauroyl/myristoyl acyltransferase